MTDSDPKFQCNKCGKTPDDGRYPFETLPAANDYWKRISAVACGPCWDEWKEMEVKVINEYRLNLLERDHRKMLKKFMHDFLNIDGTREAGAAPESPDAVAASWTPENAG
ncbi:MAG: Fe(2+)-trafficking protein [Proteobacteria bacterium]|nr:Fe(2+)-trafficking protein [Pseudomonadota bacterium]